MEAAELVVAVRSQGLDLVNAALTKLKKIAETTPGKLDLTSKAVAKVLAELQKWEKILGTIERAHKRVEKAAKEAGEKERAQLKLTWSIHKTLFDMRENASKKAANAERAHLKLVWSAAETRYKLEQAAIKQTENLKRSEMDKTHARALKDNREITASRKKMWDDAARNAKREAAAEERLKAHPFSQRIGQMLGQVQAGGSAVDRAKQTDIFRGKTFDFLIFFGTAKAAYAILKQYILEPLSKIIDTAIQFEKQWLRVAQTVTGTAPQMAQVQKDFAKLAGARPFSLEEIANAARALGELGVSTNEIVKGTDAITRFSIASGIATDEAATLIGQVLAIGGSARPTAEEIANMGSAVLDMGTSFAIGNKGVLTTMVRVSALIPLFHLSQAEALGLSTAMGSLGVKAERGATALQAFLSQARSAEGIKLERFANVIGQTVEQTKELIRTQPGEFVRQFLHGMNELSDSGYDVNKMLKELGINTSRAQQMLGSLAAGVDTVDEAMIKANDTMGKQNELLRQSDIHFQSASSLMGTLGEATSQLGASFTKDLLPFIKSSIQELILLAHGITYVIDKSNEFYDNANPWRRWARAQREDAEAMAALADKSPLINAGRPLPVDISDPNYDPISGKIKKRSDFPYIGQKRQEDERLKRQDAANKIEDKRIKKLKSDADQLVSTARNAQQVYDDTKKILDEALAIEHISPEKYSQALGEATKRRDDDLIREAERTRDAIKKSLDHSASDEQKYLATKEQNEKWLRDRVINQAQFDQNMAQAEEDRDKKKLAQMKKDQAEVARFMKQAMDARDKYNATVKQTDAFVKAGRMTPAEGDKQKAAALEKLTKAEAKAEAARNKLTAAERKATTLAEKNDPYVKYENTLELINQAVKDGLSLQDEKLAKDQAYLDLLKNIDKQNGVSQKQLDARNKKIKDYAIALNPVADLEDEIAKTRAAMKEFPGIATKMAGEEHIAQLKRDIKLPEEYERQMRIVNGIVERGMNTVADTMTDALFEGTVKGTEIMRAFAKDITNILLEEMIFKPTAMKITDAFKDFQIADFTKKMNASAPGNEGSTDLAKAADTTTKSLDELGTGALKALLDLTSGIGSFLIGLLGGSKGGGWNLKDFALTSLWGGLSKGASTFLSGYLGDTPGVVPDTTHEVPFSPVGGQSLYDPNSGFTDYNVGSRASSMTYSNAYAGQNTSTGAPPVNVTVTALDPRTAASVIMSNMPVIERGMQRAVDRGAAYARAHGRRR